VAPLFQTVPLFGYVLAYVLLSATASRASQVTGGLLIVARHGSSFHYASAPGHRFKLRLVLGLCCAAVGGGWFPPA